MKIKVINPNTTLSMTAKIGASARAAVGSGTEVVAVSPAMGPVSIESHYDEALAVPGLLQEVARGERPCSILSSDLVGSHNLVLVLFEEGCEDGRDDSGEIGNRFIVPDPMVVYRTEELLRQPSLAGGELYP